MRILMIGDVVGRPGRLCLRDMLPRIKENYQIDFIIANGANNGDTGGEGQANWGYQIGRAHV